MTRVTKREAAIVWNLGAPLDGPTKFVPAKRAKADRPEMRLHIAVAKYLRIRAMRGDMRWFSTMTEGYRSAKRAGISHAMGLTPGVPDIIVFVYDDANQLRKTIFFELKAANGKLSPPQEEWRAWLQDSGFQWYLIFGVDEVANVLE